VTLVAHVKRGHEKFVGLAVLDHLLGREELDRLSLDAVCWGEVMSKRSSRQRVCPLTVSDAPSFRQFTERL
jgi:hypothetical protein